MVNICLICDFFYPCLGGVEMHIFQLGLCLIERGHKVIIITHKYQGRSGVRYMTNGLKVYYCPFIPAIQTVVLFTYVGTLPIFRQILLREEIHVVHSHAATSYLGGELLLHAKSMGFKTVFTDHSLFAFNDAASFHVNKILKYILCEIDHSISVSHVSKENLSMRASLDPRNISVIPNAVDCSRFTPNPSKRYPLNTINIVVICRMTFRKGVDLLVDVLQVICKQHPEIYFIIGGDGPKKKILEETIQRYNLQNQTELLGSVPGHQVKDVLNRGHIFLNTSLTEAFCIAIVEAASCGLCVVSTNVGGISEVLPKNMVLYADPTPEDICHKITQAIPIAKNFQVYQQHELVKKMYSWEQVAERTEKVYYNILWTQIVNTILHSQSENIQLLAISSISFIQGILLLFFQFSKYIIKIRQIIYIQLVWFKKQKKYFNAVILQTQNQTILKRFKDCYSNGQIYGLYLMILLIFDLIFLMILDFLQPHKGIQKPGIFNQIYKNQKEKFGDHLFKADQQN